MYPSGRFSEKDHTVASNYSRGTATVPEHVKNLDQIFGSSALQYIAFSEGRAVEAR